MWACNEKGEWKWREIIKSWSGDGIERTFKRRDIVNWNRDIELDSFVKIWTERMCRQVYGFESENEWT